MKTKAIFTLIVFAFVTVCSAETIRWVDARDLRIEGKGWTDTKEFYDRFPARAEKVIRPAVWNLSRDSAGMCVRFVSDASDIQVRWVLRKENLQMPHMAASGVSGVDLYIHEKDKWHWVGAGRPKAFPTNEMVVVKGLNPGAHEFILYLPLYNGVHEVKIGVPENAKIEPAPARGKKPIVFYGTSILHGACASRPGMAYPSILGRKLNEPIINLGFSGNAWSEPEIASLLAELNPSVYVIDPIPNMTSEMIDERMQPLIRKLRAAHPKTPIVMVESLAYTDGDYVKARHERCTSSNAAMRRAYEVLRKTEKNLFYISSDNLIGHDFEGTVDGTHPNDLGFMRMTEVIEPVLRKAVSRAK